MIRYFLLLLALLAATPAAAQDTARETAQVEDLRSIREIKRLQAEWGYLAFAGEWKAMAALGTEYVEIVLPGGNVVGREAFEQWLRERMGNGHDGIAAGRLNARIFYSPVVTLSAAGDRATARWRHLALTGEDDVAADWRQTTDVIEYHKTREGWRIAFIRPYLQFSGPYETGFTHDAKTLERAPFHYTPEEAGAILTGREAAAPRAEGDLQAEATLLYEQGTAQNLVDAFGFYLDRGMYDDIADLFAPDGTVDVAGQGTYAGPDGVRKFLGRFGAPGLDEGELNDRPQLMPETSIAADGSMALVRTTEFGMTGQHGGTGVWSLAINTFLLRKDEEGHWRIAMLHRRPLMRADYQQGWAHPLAAAEPIAEPFLPEGPPQPVDTSYPEHPFAMQQLGSGVVFAPRGEAQAMPLEPEALAKAEAFDAAENLADAYGGYIDQFAWPQMAGLFADDGWRELPFIGVVRGRQKILDAAMIRYGDNGAGPRAEFQAIHSLAQPYVTPSADGRRAQARMRLIQWNSTAGAPGGWIAGVYEWQVRKVGETWKLAGMDLDYTWLASYRGGWTEANPAAGDAIKPSPELLARYHIDGPIRGDPGFPFPRIATLPFHFANPVSGREPPRRIEWSDDGTGQ